MLQTGSSKAKTDLKVIQAGYDRHKKRGISPFFVPETSTQNDHLEAIQLANRYPWQNSSKNCKPRARYHEYGRQPRLFCHPSDYMPVARKESRSSDCPHRKQTLSRRDDQPNHWDERSYRHWYDQRSRSSRLFESCAITEKLGTGKPATKGKRSALSRHNSTSLEFYQETPAAILIPLFRTICSMKCQHSSANQPCSPLPP